MVSIEIQSHLFGPNLLASAIVMESLCEALCNLAARHRLRHGRGPNRAATAGGTAATLPSLIEIALIENNDNVEDDYRVIVDANTFGDNDFGDDLIALHSLNAGTGAAPSFYLGNNSNADNRADSLLHCDGGDHIVDTCADLRRVEAVFARSADLPCEVVERV